MCRFPMWASKKWDPINKKYKVTFLMSVNQNDNIESIKKTCLLRNEELIQLPCGRCIDCRLARSKDWANRCMLETKEHKDNYFITLTYDDEHLPKGNGIDTETGELYETETLKPKDMQDFMKRLRSHYLRKYKVENIRFYGCGEYGEKYGRPHYHLIVFGLPIFDLKPDHKSKKGNMNYTSKEIQELWGKGLIAIGTVTWDSCAYTARYIIKKQVGEYADELYKVIGKEKEFVRMSRRPGIAKNFYEQNKNKIYNTDEIFISTNKGVQKIKPARYYDKLFDIDNHAEMEKIKKARQELAEMRQKLKYLNTDMDPEEAYKNELETKDLKYKSLRRNYEKA